MTSKHLAPLTALLLLMAPLAAGTTPTTAAEGDHTVLHFRMDNPTGAKTVVFALEDASGDLVLYAYVSAGKLYASDGASGGVDRAGLLAHGLVGTEWYRVDVVLSGSTYRLEVDQGPGTTARTHTAATAASLRADTSGIFPGITPETVLLDRVRHDDDGGAREHTFTDPVASNGWSAVESGGTLQGAPAASGHQGRGALLVDGGILGVAYVHASTAGMGGTYVAEASAVVDSTYLPPLDQAVLAGLSGPASTPTANWAVLLARSGTALDEWSLFFEAPDGSRTKVGDDWFHLAYHAVRVHVDEAGGRIDVFVDGAHEATYLGTVPSSGSVGVGDVSSGLLAGYGAAAYDDIALYEEA